MGTCVHCTVEVEGNHARLMLGERLYLARSAVKVLSNT